MKKFCLICFTVLLLIPFTVKAEDKNNDQELIKNATSGLLMEASTGKIIFEKEKDKHLTSNTRIYNNILHSKKINSTK